ncbi:hypothetical protein K7X08_022838 [Anisodus acutangulus]|uniref:Uncharacterized protein n=1 Tax=Anisodus acutangulus TaxID=402998 RepID=A0A9Q1MF41_9SOLA|nr:hypothetical protein K7X08_022838 [Anisodus acutangulus]
MSRFPMNRYNEQRLIQEVHYLHSLLHQGPPRPHPPIPAHPPPYQIPIPTPVSLQPSSSTQFKKRKKKNSKTVNEAIIVSGIEWPCPKPSESSPVTESGWGSFTPQPTQPHLPTVEELANFTSNRAHQQALKAVSEYLKYPIDDSEDEEKGEKDYEFFVKLFEEDGGLREYYEKNRESGGEFSCLLCCGVGKKGRRNRFKDCVALVQHSITIANTKRRRAHRAYGLVICNILGWDITRLSSIVLTARYNKPSESSHKPAEPQRQSRSAWRKAVKRRWYMAKNKEKKTVAESEGLGIEGDGGKNGLSSQSNTTDTVNIGSNELSQQKEPFGNENQQENGAGSTALEHNSTSEANANRSLEDVSNDKLETGKENAEGASNCPEPVQEDTTVANEENNCQKDDVSKETTIVSDMS